MKEDKTNKFSNEKLIRLLPGFTDSNIEVNGLKFHYVRGGSGQPLILLPGWPQTWWAYHKIMSALSISYDVIAVDLRGMGNSSKPANGYDKKTMAGDIAALVSELNLGSVNVVGHDIGAAVAFSFAANYPELVLKTILIDLLHPEESVEQFPLIPAYGTFDGKTLNPSSPYLWWWSFLQVKRLPEQLMAGRSHLLYEWFFNNTLANTQAISEFDRSVFYHHYSNEDDIRSSNAWFQEFSKDIADQKKYPILKTPVLGIGGGSFGWMSAILPTKASNSKTVHIVECGHFPADEQPEQTVKAMLEFLSD
jgi:pimeloyl-ACP methyl ester carboxylesterase